MSLYRIERKLREAREIPAGCCAGPRDISRRQICNHGRPECRDNLGLSSILWPSSQGRPAGQKKAGSTGRSRAERLLVPQTKSTRTVESGDRKDLYVISGERSRGSDVVERCTRLGSRIIHVSGQGYAACLDSASMQAKRWAGLENGYI
ncbi:hypothetical protein HPB50_004421 [Hyalomma asiaticum]|uniref:Uncharacterized protein n=1 Tax=Hyalomma asiaticum TaxID=266040 RepID=A0ACB7TF22_HYAAI|nr:hypothetical protein HPB50_004421 [Hyalomma asiaticum]